MNINSYLWLLPLSYIVLYVAYSAVKTLFPSTEKIIFCPMCSAYFTVFVVGFFLNFPAIIQSFLVGMSATGIAYQTDKYLNNKGKNYFAQHFLLQLTMTILSLILIVYYIA